MNASNSRFTENRNRRGHNGTTDGCIESNSLTLYDYIIDLVHAEVRSDKQTDSIQMKSKRMLYFSTPIFILIWKIMIQFN